MPHGAADPRTWHGKRRPPSRSALTRPDVRAVPVFIYALTEPGGAVRYVGKSANPRGRLASHAHETGAPDVRDWLRALRADGLDVSIVVLHEVPPGVDAAPIERGFIEAYAATGSLLNVQGTKRRGGCRFCRGRDHNGQNCTEAA